MIVKTTITERREINKNIDLPYYSKDINNYYRINEDESILRVTANSGETYCAMSLSKKGEFFDCLFLDDAIKGETCSAEEVEEAVRHYLKFVGSTIDQLAESV